MDIISRLKNMHALLDNCQDWISGFSGQIFIVLHVALELDPTDTRSGEITNTTEEKCLLCWLSKSELWCNC